MQKQGKVRKVTMSESVTIGAVTRKTGWECPRCHRCYAPWVEECKHCGGSITSGTFTVSGTATGTPVTIGAAQLKGPEY